MFFFLFFSLYFLSRVAWGLGLGARWGSFVDLALMSTLPLRGAFEAMLPTPLRLVAGDRPLLQSSPFVPSIQPSSHPAIPLNPTPHRWPRIG